MNASPKPLSATLRCLVGVISAFHVLHSAVAFGSLCHPHSVYPQHVLELIKHEAASSKTDYTRELMQAFLDAPAVVCSRRVHRLCPTHRSNSSHPETALVYPISFSLPAHRFRTTVPPKFRLFSTVIPARPETYKYVTGRHQSPEEILNTEDKYLNDMARSVFSITFAKSGWDCQRHVEILASAALPIFTDIEQVPAGMLSSYPVNVFAVLKKWPGLTVKGVKGMPAAADGEGVELNLTQPLNKTLYMLADQAMISLSRHLLTTRAMAQHVISIVGISASSRILYITWESQHPYADFQGDTLLHGFLSVMRANVVDVPKLDHLFQTEETFNETEFADKKVGLYACGFGGVALGTYEAPGAVKRDDIRKRIRNKEFDYVIFGYAHRPTLWDYYDDVCSTYSKDKVIAVHGGDTYPGGDPAVVDCLARLAACSSHIFSRELDGQCVDAPKQSET